MPTTAKIIADSISESGVRLTTMVLEYPRIIHSEFMTHRMFSRNASSSRAIPVEKQIERVENDPFIPIYWGANQKGMQASEECNIPIKVWESYEEYYSSNEADLKWEEVEYTREEYWQKAIDSALEFAKRYKDARYHKQLVNRLLEPFSHIQVVVTATEWDNFFLQRLDKNAQPEIQELAKVMKEAMDNSTPEKLEVGQWHLPFINWDEDMNGKNWEFLPGSFGRDMTPELIKISVARCARVSYGLNERGWGDIEKDLALYDMLLTNWHYSPFEHQATPMDKNYRYNSQLWQPGITHFTKDGEWWSNNFKGWKQNRAIIQSN